MIPDTTKIYSIQLDAGCGKIMRNNRILRPGQSNRYLSDLPFKTIVRASEFRSQQERSYWLSCRIRAVKAGWSGSIRESWQPQQKK